jgi:hypothetical protein
MTEFSDILDGLEKRGEPPFRDAGRGYRLFETLYDVRESVEPPAAPKVQSEPRRSGFDRLVDVYNQFMKAETPRAERPAPAPDYAAILSDLRRKKRSVEDLRALRRAVAWKCHPDRAPADQRHRAIAFMAEFNSELDALMARRRKADEQSRAAS